MENKAKSLVSVKNNHWACFVNNYILFYFIHVQLTSSQCNVIVSLFGMKLVPARMKKQTEETLNEA